MLIRHYIGFDIHKKTIWFCVKDITGAVLSRGTFPATREAIEAWCGARTVPWVGLMEATMFAFWIFDAMRPYAVDLRIGHPAAMKTLLLSKNKGDKKDAERFAEMARCELVPALYILSPSVRALRRRLRVRNLLQRQTVQLKNRMAALLMEVGVVYDPRKIHTKRYYQELIASPVVPGEVRFLLRILKQQQTGLLQAQRAIFRCLEKAPEIQERVKLLQTIPGVGMITALNWALETGDVARFPSVRHAISYCGLVSARNESAGKDRRGPLSKMRNKYLQHVLIEIGHLAPRLYWKYKEVYDQVAHGRSSNAATIAVARKLVAYLMAVDRSGKPFVKEEPPLAVSDASPS